MTETRKSGQFVAPGDKMGVIEEFIPNSGTYIEDGVIHAKNAGYVLIDYSAKKVSVYPLARNINIPRVGNIVLGNIETVQNSLAVLRMIKIGRKSSSGSFTGLIHVSYVGFRYTETMFDAYRVGDIVRAEVISDKNRAYHLSTRGENLGAIYAFCSRCGQILAFKNKRLQCDRCGGVEKRKIALDYGSGAL